jgi:hypothetical protein
MSPIASPSIPTAAANAAPSPALVSRPVEIRAEINAVAANAGTLGATTATTTIHESTSNVTGNQPKLRNGKPIPSSDDWRALERRALSFRLR